jgi:hypothetical protein
MFKKYSLICVAASVVMISHAVEAQQCSTCMDTFGYPTQSSHGAAGSRHERWDALKAENAKSTARNDAWPKPFACADRQLFHEIWMPMINEGFEEQCVLNEAHFDAQTNELNAFGMHAVAGIMQNMPTHRKHEIVSRDTDDDVTQARLSSVQSTVQTFYGQLNPTAQVTLSNKQPSAISGVRAESISSKYVAGQPVPSIPISSGDASVGSSLQ